MLQEPRKTGVIKWFDPVKGFGYITLDHGAEIFCHETQIAVGDELMKGDRVECTHALGKDGRSYARDIVVLDK
jgi:cold shock CspA family protein